MFSLLIIPVVFWYYGSNYIKENDYRVLGFNMPPKDYFETYPEEDYKVNYNCEEFNVPINFSQETEENFFEIIKNLQEKNIDKSGVKFQLTSENTYNDIIKLLNLMEKTEQGRYLFDFKDDYFYVLHHEVSKDLEERPILSCDLVVYDDRSTLQIIKTDIIEQFIQKIPKFLYPILIGYFILVICAIFRPKIFIPL